MKSPKAGNTNQFCGVIPQNQLFAWNAGLFFKSQSSDYSISEQTKPLEKSILSS